MDKFTDPSLKHKYNKSKLKLKLWEGDFRTRTGKNPCKDDIKEAPSEIRDAYKWYWQIKIHALGQDSMFDATFVEKTDVEGTSSVSDSGLKSPSKQEKNSSPTEEKACMQEIPILHSEEIPNKADDITSQHDDKTSQHDDKTSQHDDKTSQHDDSDQQPDAPLPKSVWGTHLNKRQSLDITSKKTNLNRSSSSFQLSEKLFVGAKLKKRNPRKSLSFSAGRLKEKGLVSSDSLSNPSDSFMSIDCSQGTDDGFSISDLEKEMSNKKIPQNLDFIVVRNNVVSNTQPISAVHKIIGSDSNITKPRIERNLDQGWLERVSQADSTLDLGAKGNAVIPNIAVFDQRNVPESPDDSDDDIIYGSDTESKSPGKTAKEEKSRLALRSVVSMDSSSFVEKVDSIPTNQQINDVPNLSVKKRKLDAMDAAMAILTDRQKSERLTLLTNKKLKTADVDNENCDEEVDENSDVSVPLRKKTPRTKKEILENKVATGTVNENFVRINIQKKVFVRGKKTMNFQKYKKQQWKKKKKELSDQASAYISRMDPSDSAAGGGLQKCYKCGDVGHFARQCTQMKGDSLIPHDAEGMEESPFPSLEEVAKMARDASDKVHHRKKTCQVEEVSLLKEADNAAQCMGNSIECSQDSSEDLEEDRIPENDDGIMMNIMKEPSSETERKYRSVEPLYSTNSDGSLIETPAEVFQCLQKFGHQNFRPGQEVAIMRILSGLSTLVTLSTGSGKSLCYQLPAYLFASKKKCITLVVSPLVSLMDDQISGLPSFIKGAALHTGQTEKQREKVVDLAKSGKLQFLLVSPEAVVAGEKQSGFGSLLRSLPDIAFACIDEAHCVSQWSHNFRPSYLVLFKVLREKLGVQTILGLTATATQSAVSSIIEHVGILDGRRGVIQDTPLPNNLVLTVSCDPRRDQALIKLVSSWEYEDFSSIIVYCTRREECERLAALLRTCLKSTSTAVIGTSKISTIAEAYHAGFSSARRKQVQNAFMTGNLRIVVATVAFGMGINKADIRSVIHFNMPRNFESYVQEVGRAGRDGKMSRCHLFLSSEGKDMNELRRHINADSVDRHTIRKLLQRVFVPCNCGKITNDSSEVSQGTDKSLSSEVKLTSQPCVGHEVAFSVDETVAALDLPEENITTLLCYLELYDKNLLQVMPKAYTHCRIQSYKGMKHIEGVARNCPPLAMAIAMNFTSTKSQKTSQLVEFPVVEIASAINWDSGVVKRELKNLEWIQVDERFRRSGIKVDFLNLGFRVKAPGNLSPERLDAALDFLYERAVKQELSAVYQLQTIFDAVTSVSLPSVHSMLDLTESDVETRSNTLKSIVRAYFQEERQAALENIKTEEKLENGEQIANDIRQLVNMYRDCNFTGRSVARIFHGISSPNFPAQTWGRCRFWRIYLNSDFKLICLLATRVLLQMR